MIIQIRRVTPRKLIIKVKYSQELNNIYGIHESESCALNINY